LFIVVYFRHFPVSREFILVRFHYMYYIILCAVYMCSIMEICMLISIHMYYIISLEKRD